jgi:hypothetical protein
MNLEKNKSEDLAAQIVAYRALGINKDVALKCMEELSNRRKNGDDFNFEEYIELELKKITKIPDSNISNLGNTVNSVFNSFKHSFKK